MFFNHYLPYRKNTKFPNVVISTPTTPLRQPKRQIYALNILSSFDLMQPNGHFWQRGEYLLGCR